MRASKRVRVIVIGTALIAASCGADDTDGAQEQPAGDEPAPESNVDGTADEPAPEPSDEGTTDEPAPEPSDEGTEPGTEPEVVPSDDMDDYPDELRNPALDGWQPSLCEPTAPAFASRQARPPEPVESDVALEIFPEGLVVGEFTYRSFFVNDAAQVFSVYSSSDDDASAQRLFSNSMCIESVPSSEELELDAFADGESPAEIPDNEVFAAIEEEIALEEAFDEAGNQLDLDPSADAEEALVATQADQPEGLRVVLIAPEFCDDAIPQEFENRCRGNDDLLGQSVVTHVFIDPTVGRGHTDRYSTISASSVSSTVKSSRHRVFAAIRKQGSWTKVSYSSISQGYSRTLRARPPQVGPVWMSVYGYRSNSSTAVYSVTNHWRTESYSK